MLHLLPLALGAWVRFIALWWKDWFEGALTLAMKSSEFDSRELSLVVSDTSSTVTTILN